MKFKGIPNINQLIKISEAKKWLDYLDFGEFVETKNKEEVLSYFDDLKGNLIVDIPPDPIYIGYLDVLIEAEGDYDEDEDPEAFDQEGMPLLSRDDREYRASKRFLEEFIHKLEPIDEPEFNELMRELIQERLPEYIDEFHIWYSQNEESGAIRHPFDLLSEDYALPVYKPTNWTTEDIIGKIKYKQAFTANILISSIKS